LDSIGFDLIGWDYYDPVLVIIAEQLMLFLTNYDERLTIPVLSRFIASIRMVGGK